MSYAFSLVSLISIPSVYCAMAYCKIHASNIFDTGLAESTFYPGMQYIIGSWYRKDELAKRSCIFHTSSALGSMFSGYLMAGVYSLGGRGGYKGWQWYCSPFFSVAYPNAYLATYRLFIVDGIISLPVALAGYFVLPDVPEISKPFYLTKEVYSIRC